MDGILEATTWSLRDLLALIKDVKGLNKPSRDASKEKYHKIEARVVRCLAEPTLHNIFGDKRIMLSLDVIITLYLRSLSF